MPSRMRRLRRLRWPQVALIALLALVLIGYLVHAADAHHHGGLQRGSVALSSLPAQASQTVRLIEQGGPFPYPQDGEIFNNAEHRLPPEPRGYYHEFTVPTPGSPDRGARRIIAGGANREFFYTPDHYETFQRVDTTR
ncbi:MAG TPA: ribonuclease domain-containing protein [Jatrophihabitantaceae bacterium]|nr:ribonuclease domain-containing protein [Jatrophihabitantaceae bacterium]